MTLADTVVALYDYPSKGEKSVVMVEKAHYWDESMAVRLWDEYGGGMLAIASVNLADAYGLTPVDGAFFVETYADGGALADALVRAGVVERTGRVVAFGPFDTTAVEVRFTQEWTDILTTEREG